MINKFIVGIGSREREYTVNNVRYTVSSKFLPSKERTTFQDRIKRSVVSDFAHLQLVEKGGKMSAENVCLTAGEEDACSQRKRRNR